MPRRGRQQLQEQRVFFVTTTVKGHRPLFRSERRLQALRQIIFTAIDRHRAKLYGYALMPSHLHLLLYVPDGGPALAKFMRDIKSLSARMIFPEKHGIWMARFDDVAIYSDEQFRTKLNYIHQNPVKAALAENPEEYEYSSAKEWLRGVSDGGVVIEF